MKFVVKAGPVARQRSGCLILPVFAGGALPTATADADRAAGGFIRRLLRQGDFRAEAGDTLLLPKLPGLATPRVLLAGLGARERCDRKALRKAVRAAFMALGKAPVTAAVSYLGTVDVRGTDAYRRARIAAESWHDSAYRFLPHKTRETGNQPPKLRSLALAAAGDTAAVRRGLAHGDAIGRAISLARDLGNEPPNVCTPSWLAQRAREVAGRHRKLRVQVLDEARMRRLGMGSLLSVTAGSAQPARFVVMQYQGARAGDAPVVFVGKGITFDTGGINLKVQGGIEEMKFDMCGAASVIGSFLTVAKLRLPINLVVIAAAVENMPDGDAYRPSDVLTSMSGKTIEVGNTDAEGRLILCDALTYVQRFEPTAIVDVATLTGACMIALGKVATGLMSKHDDLADELLRAGEQVHDRAWRLPIWDDYQPLLDSSFADVYNIGGRWAGAITAGCFLARFTEGQRWAHLDIAGSGSDEGRKGMATGRPVGLLTEWLAGRARDS